MASLSEAFNSALLRFLIDRGFDAVAVSGFDTDTRTAGGCETCDYSYVVCEITYVNSDGRNRWYDYEGDFGELIRELDRVSA